MIPDPTTVRGRHSPEHVVHIEDDPMWTEVVAKLIRERSDFGYAGAASSASAGRILCERVQPQLVILDLFLPDADGLELVDTLAADNYQPHVLLLTARCDDVLLHRLRARSVVGMVWKNQYLPMTFHRALEAAANGQRYLPPEILEAERQLHREPLAFFKILSNREMELMPLLGRGDTDSEIAQKLGLQASTVKSHREHVLHKLGLHSTKKLMRWATERGFVTRIGR